MKTAIENMNTVIESAAAKVIRQKRLDDLGKDIEREFIRSHPANIIGRFVIAGATKKYVAVVAPGIKKHEADVAAANLARERAYTAIDRMMLLEMLESDIMNLKQLATTKLPLRPKGRPDVISPSNWALSHLHPVQLRAKEIQSSLRSLSAVDGVDAAIAGLLRTESKRVHDRTIDAARAQEAVPFQADIDAYLVYAENRVVRHILEKMVRRYSPSSTPFELTRALVDVIGQLALNNANSITRVQELTKLYKSGQSSKPVTAYYEALYSQINSSR